MLDELKIKIQEKLNIEISSLRFLSSGNQCKIYVIESENKNYIAKKSEANSKNNLLIEAKMIEFLAKNSQILVPKIYFKDDNLIVMEYIENNDYQQHQIAFAKDLAQLHMISNDQYGLEFDNLIGSLPQSNKLNQNWSDFFIFERILFMSKLCYEKKRMDLSFLKKIEAFCIKIPQYLTNNNKPSLIHGDLWQGNILCNNESQIFLIDPAIYFADYEIELAS